MIRLVQAAWTSSSVGWVFSLVLLLGGLLGRWQLTVAGGRPLIDPGQVPGSAGIGLASVGLVSLFLGMLYQRRYQRADELIRELALLRDPTHPDYRELLQLRRSWTPARKGAVDPRWAEKHERTQKTTSRLREYRQLFTGVPRFARVATGAFTGLVALTALYWLLTLSFRPPWVGFLNLLGLAGTLEILVHLTRILWRITLFPEQGEDESLEGRLGIPSWYHLLDVRCLEGRLLPFTSLVATHETYLCLTERIRDGRPHWVLSLQLPFPVRGWQFRCTASLGSESIATATGTVQLTAPECDRFFAEPGLWLDTPVVWWPRALTAPDRFDQLVITLTLRGGSDGGRLLLTIPAGPDEGRRCWYGGSGPGVRRPYRYPWYNLRLERAGITEGLPFTATLLRPGADPTVGERGEGR